MEVVFILALIFLSLLVVALLFYIPYLSSRKLYKLLRKKGNKYSLIIAVVLYILIFIITGIVFYTLFTISFHLER